MPALKHKRFFKAWILRIVHNTAVEWIRKNARLVQMETIEENIEEQSVHDDLTMKVTLKEAVSALKPVSYTHLRWKSGKRRYLWIFLLEWK